MLHFQKENSTAEMVNTFDKRPGTTDYGKDYEDFNIASIVLKFVTDPTVKQFAISSNDKKFGSFDDIVVEVKTEANQEGKYALQLKHTNNSRTLQIQSLTQPKGDFSISKYCESYKEIFKTKSSHQLILYTNRKCALESGKIISFDEEGFSVTVLKCQPNAFLNTSERGHCYKFSNLQNNIGNNLTETQHTYKQFFENFFLYTDQADVNLVEANTKQKFQEAFSCKEEECYKYFRFISEWNKREGRKDKLDETLMKRVIAMCVLSPHIKPFTFGPVNNKMKLLQRAINSFNVTIFEEMLYDELKTVFGNAKNELLSLKRREIDDIERKYQLNFNQVHKMEDLDDENCSVMLWLLNKCPLIVSQTESSLKAIQLNRNENFILLRHVTAESQLGEASVFKKLSDVTDVNLTKSIMNNFKYSIQGKRDISLKELVENNQDVLRIITTDDLLRMSQHTLLIGGEKEILPKPYISRYLSKNIIDLEYFKNINKDTLIVVFCKRETAKIKELEKNHSLTNLEEYLEEIKHSDNAMNANCDNKSNAEIATHTEHQMIDNNSDRRIVSSVQGGNKPDAKISFLKSNFTILPATFYISHNDSFIEDFESLRKTKFPEKKCHYFKLTENDDLEWLYSTGDIDDLKKYRIESVGDRNHWIKEDYFYSINTNNINVVIGDPGIGKTSLVNNIKNNSSSNIWSIIFNAIDMSSLCEHLSGRKFDKDIIRDAIMKVKCDCDATTQDRRILEVMLRNNQILYVWDGLDEISLEEMDLITDIIFELSKNKSAQWITSRTHCKNDLETKFKTLSKTIKDFDHDDQWSYLNERLSQKNHDLRNRLKERMFPLYVKKLFGNPLHICMLTELLLHNTETIVDLLKDTFNLIDLFQHFIDTKINLYYKDKIEATMPKSALANLLKREKLNRLKNYQNASLMALVPELKIECEELFLEEIRETGDCFGIITEVRSDGVACFVHNTFSEYFAAVYFSEKSRSIPNLRNILFERKNMEIRYFFDLLLAKRSPAHLAVLYKNYDTIPQYGEQLSTCKDLGGRSVLHLACSWGWIYPRFDVKYNNGIYDVLDTECDDFYIMLPQPTKYTKMLQYLLDKCDVSDTDELFSSSSLAYADETNCLFNKVLVLQSMNKRFSVLTEDPSITSVVFFSALFNHDKIINMYDEFPLMKLQSDDSTPLHVAVRNPIYLAKLLSCDKYQSIVDNKNTSGATPLYYACVASCKHSVQLLLDAGAQVDAAGPLGRTPLHMACVNGNSKIINILLRSEANTEATDDEGMIPLHVACIYGHDRIIKSLVTSNNINNCDNNGWSPLLFACQDGHAKVVLLLLKYGANVNITQKQDWTPLHLACQNGHTEVVQILLDHGANIFATQNQGFTPVFYACAKGHVEVVKLLIKFNPSIKNALYAGMAPIHTACGFERYEVVHFLIKADANINIPTKDGSRALHIACQKGNTRIVKLLVKFGADINALGPNGIMPIYAACQNGNEEIVQFLINNKANLKAVTFDGWTLLHIASVKGHLNIVCLLIKKKLDINALEKDRWTPLHLACQNDGHKEVVQLLIRSGASMSLVTNDGSTTLHIASRNGCSKLVPLLVRLGAKVNATNVKNRTPLHIASRFGHVETIKKLIQTGAKIDVIDGVTGATPLHLACFRRHFDVIRVLANSGADVNALDKTHKVTPAQVAFWVEKSEIVDWLLKHGAKNEGLDMEIIGPLMDPFWYPGTQRQIHFTDDNTFHMEMPWFF